MNNKSAEFSTHLMTAIRNFLGEQALEGDVQSDVNAYVGKISKAIFDRQEFEEEPHCGMWMECY